MSRPIPVSRSLRSTLLAGLLASFAFSVQASELKLEAKLIWGTNDEKNTKKDQPPVDDVTAAKLRKVFKWKHYFLVNKQTKVVPSRGSNKFKLSEDCTVEITELEGPRVEFQVIGKGVPVHKTIKELGRGEDFVYSGNDKNETAWFVMITDLDKK